MSMDENRLTPDENASDAIKESEEAKTVEGVQDGARIEQERAQVEKEVGQFESEGNGALKGVIYAYKADNTPKSEKVYPPLPPIPENYSYEDDPPKNVKKKLGFDDIVKRVVTVLVAAIVLGVIIFLVIDLNVKPRITVENGNVTVKDTYNAEIALKDAEILLVDLPAVDNKIAGTADSKILKGTFTLKGETERVYLSIVDKKGKCVLIRSGGKRYYLNRSDAEATRALYDEASAERDRVNSL